MKSSSALLVGVLAECAIAFPGMGSNMRRMVELVPRKSTTSAASSAPTGSYPAWHPPQTGEGTNIDPELHSTPSLTNQQFVHRALASTL